MAFSLQTLHANQERSETGNAIQVSKGPLTVAPGRYALSFEVPFVKLAGTTVILIGDKNIRRPIADSGTFEQVATGHIWRTTALSGKQIIYLDTIGVTQLALTSLTPAQGDAVTQASYALSALFIGGLAMLTVYSCIVALVSKEKLFGNYAAWLFSTLAFGAITAGYDLLWLPHLENFRFEQGIRQLICAVWAATTIGLFRAMFDSSIQWPRMRLTLSILGQILWVFCAFALFVPSEYFMPSIWTVCLAGLIAITLGIAHVWGQSASSISTWYSIGWLIQLFAIGFELGGIIGFFPRLSTPPIIPAGATSALFVGIALAELLRNERTAKQNALDAVEHARSKLADFYDSSPAGLISYDRSGNLLSINRAATDYLACANEPPALAKLFSQSKRSALDANHRTLTRTASSDDAAAVQHLNLQFRETDFTTEVAVINTTADYNLQTVLKQQATTDPLSGLQNRRSLYQALHTAYNHRQATDLAPTLLMLDIVRFSDINTYFGQSVGDSVLKEVGHRLIRCGLSGQAFRLAADNFAVLMFGSQEDAVAEASKIQAAMTSTAFSIGRRSIAVTTCSAGAALSSFPDADEAINGLRFLTQLAKKDIGNVRIYGNGEAALLNWQVERRFVSLLKTDQWSNQITLFAQPLVSLAGDSEARYEMLMRVRNGAKLDLPMSFLQAAESIGMMPEIDLYVVELTLKWIESFAHPPLYVTANLSGASLADPNFTTQVSALLARHPAAAQHLCLEVTESVAVSDLARAAQFFTELRKFGVSIALDDFGQGYTNFRNLAALPVQIIKLDGSIVRDVLRSPRHAAILRCLTELTHSLGMRCVAEWVEDKATADELAAMHVDIAQGWYFSKAMPLEHWATQPFPVYLPTQEIHV